MNTRLTYVIWSLVRYRGVVRNGLFSEESEYSNYLFFEVSTRFDNLLPEQNPSNYSAKQLETYRLIKSLHDNGMSYRRITKYLNDKGVLTHKGHQWGITGNSVYSVLKRFAERQERLKSKNQKYPITRSKMWVEFTKWRWVLDYLIFNSISISHPIGFQRLLNSNGTKRFR